MRVVQNVTILIPLIDIQDIGVIQEKAEPIKTLPLDFMNPSRYNFIEL